MSWIRCVEESEATGPLTKIYEEARKRAGRVYNILKIQSQSPASLQGMLGLYTACMKGESPLTRAQREMLAVVVSRANHCHY